MYSQQDLRVFSHKNLCASWLLLQILNTKYVLEHIQSVSICNQNNVAVQLHIMDDLHSKFTAVWKIKREKSNTTVCPCKQLSLIFAEMSRMYMSQKPDNGMLCS